MDDIHKFVAEWNAKSSEGAFERYLEKEKQEAANKAAVKAEKNGIIKTAKSMLLDNVDFNTISKYTGLNKTTLTKLQKELN